MLTQLVGGCCRSLDTLESLWLEDCRTHAYISVLTVHKDWETRYSCPVTVISYLGYKIHECVEITICHQLSSTLATTLVLAFVASPIRRSVVLPESNFSNFDLGKHPIQE
jgi:hypothetical protein